MPGTGHSHRYKGSISNRVRKSPFQQLAEWNAQLLGADGNVPTITGGGGSLAFKKLDASDIDGVMHNPATEDLDMNSFNITSNGVLDISAAGLTLSSASDINIEAAGTITIATDNAVKIKSGGNDVTIQGDKMVTLIAGTAATEGIEIGNSSSQRIGFFGVTPKVQPGVKLPNLYVSLPATPTLDQLSLAVKNNGEAIYCLLKALGPHSTEGLGLTQLAEIGFTC